MNVFCVIGQYNNGAHSWETLQGVCATEALANRRVEYLTALSHNSNYSYFVVKHEVLEYIP